MRIDQAGRESLWQTAIGEPFAFASLAAAAQAFADRFYSHFIDSTVLVRLFVTVPFARLPVAEQQFARAFARQHVGDAGFAPATQVLTLLGTRGVQAQWNERERSRGHRAIPLVSEAFVSEIPMIARVLGETGFPPLLRPGAGRSQYVTRRSDQRDGLFFIGDARVTTDERGRLIIPATDFVAHYGIRTVFGFGGPYAVADPHGTFVAAIVFCRDTLRRETAAQFVPLAAAFRAATQGLLQGEAAIFPDASEPVP